MSEAVRGGPPPAVSVDGAACVADVRSSPGIDAVGTFSYACTTATADDTVIEIGPFDTNLVGASGVRIRGAGVEGPIAVAGRELRAVGNCRYWHAPVSP